LLSIMKLILLSKIMVIRSWMPQHYSQAGVPYVNTLATGWVPQAGSGEAFGLLGREFRAVAVCLALRLTIFVMQAVMQTDFGHRNADNIVNIQP
jgi:hypothetical protein